MNEAVRRSRSSLYLNNKAKDHRRAPAWLSPRSDHETRVENGFRPIPLGVFREKRKKRERKKDIMRELFKFICSCFCNLNHHFHQCIHYHVKHWFQSYNLVQCNSSHCLHPDIHWSIILQGTVHLDNAKYHCRLDNLYSNSDGICIQLAIFIALLLFAIFPAFLADFKKNQKLEIMG